MRASSLVAILTPVVVLHALAAAPAPAAAQRQARDAAPWQATAADRASVLARGGKGETMATLLGIVFPGGGHYYAGEPGRGALITAGTMLLSSAGLAVGLASCGELEGTTSSNCDSGSVAATLLIFGGLAVWTYGAIDAHRAVRRENTKHGFGALSRLTPTVGERRGGPVRVGVRVALGSD
jgi:hypothetical protein